MVYTFLSQFGYRNRCETRDGIRTTIPDIHVCNVGDYSIFIIAKLCHCFIIYDVCTVN